MKNPSRMKITLCRLIISASLPVMIQTSFAQPILTDDFTVDANQNDPNFEIGNGRQGGTAAISLYTTNTAPGDPWNVQVGASATPVGQQPPGDGNYLLLAESGAVQNYLNISTATAGPLSISFTLYNRGPVYGIPGAWGAFTLQAPGTYPFPVVNNSGEFGFLNRKSGGIQAFNGGGNMAPAGWDTVGFATNINWTLIFTDTSGTGSAFNGNGSQVTIMNGVYTLGTLSLAQLNTANLELGFRADNEGGGANLLLIGIDNLAVAPSLPPAWLPFVVQDISPASTTVAVGSNVVFTAAFSNSPPVSLQWLQNVSGSPNVTNNVSTGVVTVTNNGVVTSTLTLNNVQPASSASYQLVAVNATNSAAIVYTTAAPLTVVPTITWYAAGTGNGTFLDDSVLTFAGTVANEVYGVDFGGSGPQTTANGYTFNDYAGSGNMSVVSSGLLNFGSYEGSASTGDFSFDTILNNGVYGTSANTGTLNNLTVGQAYTVLVLLDDTRTSGASGPTFDVTDGLTFSPAQSYAFPNGTPAIGGFIMGTFTAEATNQPLTVLENGNAQYIAILLEKGTAPAPRFAPTLTTDISPLLSEVTAGGPVTLSVVAAGSPPLYYQWSDQDGPISGATNSSYSFNALAGTNYYYVGVTNSVGGLDSSTATVVSSTNIVTVNNFSFENGTTGSGNLVVPVMWTSFNDNNFSAVADNSYSVVDPLAPPADGNDFFAINEGPSDPTGGIYQNVGALLPNTTYTLTVAIGLREDFTPGVLGSPGIISLINGTDDTGIVLATTNGVPDTSDTWQDYTVSFITGPSVSGDLTVELSVAGASTYQANFDNVRLTKTPAPPVVAPTLIKDINPLRSEVTTGAPWTLSVTVNGNPLYFQWYSQSGPISGATNSSYSFNAIAGTNSYYVDATNTAGAVVSSTAVVISAPNLVTVNNFSFENGSTPAFGNGAIPLFWTDYNSDWCTVSGDTSALNPPIIPDGSEYYARNTGPGDAAAGGIYQDVGPLLPYTSYALTVAIGRRDDTGPGGLGNWSPGIISLINGTSNDGTLLTSTTGYPDVAGTWQDYTVTFMTGASVSGDLTVELSVAPAPTYQALFDDVRLTKAGVFQFAPATFSGGNLILQGGGGPADGSYSLLTTTNLSDSSSWTTYTTGTLDETGAFSNSVPVTAAPARYFRVVHTP
jgi:hypothetical protein